jgi:curved DNA-binding protein CbpA
MKDYYQILGVSYNAREGEIKSAFRKLVLRYHPDKNASVEAASLILEINEAYEILSDPIKKNLYDSILTGKQQLVQPPMAPHRDPAYRRRARNPNFKSKRQQMLEMMAEYLPITLFMSRLGFALVVFIALDFLLPSTAQEETIIKTKVSTVGRHQTSNKKFYTDKGTGFEVNYQESKNFEIGSSVRITYSSFVHVPKVVETKSNHILIKIPTTIYGSFIFMPLLLLITSTLGSFFRRGVEFDFNLGITNLLITLFTVVFLFIHKMI